MKIYFKIRKKPKNIKELLMSGFSKVSGVFKSTFKNPECTEEQCHQARRSFDDLFSICRTYFPKTLKRELAKLLFELNKEIGLGGLYCYTIKKPVFFIRGMNYPLSIFFRGDDITKKGKSRYSYKIIENLSKE